MLAESTLERELDAVGRRRFVVVTDRYPPHSHGGAEVSLHIALRAMGLGDDVLVVAYGDRDLVPRRYAVDGVDVLVLPRQGKWPLHRSTHAATLQLGPLPRPFRERVLRATQEVALRLGPYDSPRVRELAFRLRNDVRPRGGPVMDFLEYPHGSAARALRRVLERCRPEVVHADNYRAIVTLAEAGRGLGVSCVGLVRDNRFNCVRHDQSVRVASRRCVECGLECAAVDAPSAPELQREALRRSRDLRLKALRELDRVIVTSRYLWRAIAPHVDEAKLVRIPNTPDDLSEVREHTRGVAELPGINLVVVGMINENKGQLELVRRLDRLVDRIPDVRIHFAGRGARMERAMKDVAYGMGLSDRLVFHGYVDRARLYELYRECQIAALPTIWPEPFGRVPLEAGVTRRPAVAFGVGGLRESIVDGVTGLLVEPGDFVAFLAALGRLADDPGLRRKMGAAAEGHVLAEFAITELQRSLCAVWEELDGGG